MHLEYNPGSAGRIKDEADGFIDGTTKVYQYVPTKEEIAAKAGKK
jgi:hypothetical protein